MQCFICGIYINEFFGIYCAECKRRMEQHNPLQNVVYPSRPTIKSISTNIIEITGEKILGGERFEVHVHPEFPCRPIKIDVDHASYWLINDCRVGNNLHVLKPLDGTLFERYFGNSIRIDTITPATRLTIKGVNRGKKMHRFHAVMTVEL